MENIVKIDQTKCNGCGICVNDCISRVLKVENGKCEVMSDACLKCGHCVAICPSDCFEMSGFDNTEISNEIGTVDTESLLKHLKSRRSVRNFKEDKVEEAVIDTIIEAGRYTPSASNRQTNRYIIVEDVNYLEELTTSIYKGPGFEHMLERLSFNPGYLFKNAPSLILVVSDSEADGYLSSMNMELMAQSMGLGVLHVGLFTYPANTNKEVLDILGIQEHEKIVNCLAIGYPKVKYLRTAQKYKAKVTRFTK